MKFSNKVVLVTGASSGIGAAIALSFAKEGANVVTVGRDQYKLKNIAEQCEMYGKVPLVIQSDITIDEEAKRIVDKIIERYGKLDVLVNNAGIVRYGSILGENFIETYDEIMRTNLRAVVNITANSAPHLVESKGCIINISSTAGHKVPCVPLCLYSVSKAGLIHFTKGVALEMAEYGVRVNAVSPGPVKTDILKNSGIDTEPWDEIKLQTALGKVGDPDDIADLVVYLSSDKAKSISGSIYVCDNGLLLK